MKTLLLRFVLMYLMNTSEKITLLQALFRKAVSTIEGYYSPLLLEYTHQVL